MTTGLRNHSLTALTRDAFRIRGTFRDGREAVLPGHEGPGILVACDPSLHSTGFAVFVDGDLSRTTTARVPQRVTGEDAEGELLTAVRIAVQVCADPLQEPIAALSVVEDPRLPPMPGKSSYRSAAALAYSFGVARMALRAQFGPGVHAVKVQTWKAAYGIRGTEAVRAKRAAQTAAYIWPDFNFGTQDEVDAALLGRWVIQTQWMRTITGVL